MMKTNSDFIRHNLIYKGVVVSMLDDGTGYHPIKCRIETVDDEIPDSDLSPCYSLLPKFLNVYPKVGEYVYIVMLEIKDGSKKSNQEKRYFIGPVISTFTKLSADFDDDAESDSPIKPTLKYPDKGIYPKKNWVSLLGRENSDITFKPQEVIIRAGQHFQNEPLKFNNRDTAYIQIRYGNPKLTKVTKQIPKTTISLPSFEGFVTVTVTPTTNSQDVRIEIEDKDHSFIGKIVKSYSMDKRDEAINFVHDIFLKLKSNDVDTIKLIIDNNGSNPSLSYDLSKFKYINDNISELKNLNINPKSVKTITFEEKEVEEVSFDGSKGSITNIVSNQINLISHANGENFKLLDPENYITPEEQIRINTIAQPTVFGNNMNDFLNLIKTFIATHVHPYTGAVTDPDDNVQKILNFDLETLLNKNIRTG